MKSSGVSNQVQVTRAVYELIYAYNFHVTERGDIDTGGGLVLRTYVINPWTKKNIIYYLIFK